MTDFAGTIGPDSWTGTPDSDTAHGGDGNDTLDGAGGADSLIDANPDTGADGVFAFVGANAFSRTAGELRVFQYGGESIVQGDVNGDGVADFVLGVTTATPLAASDFVL